ncbi:MAG: PqqD family protein [Clostridia bacterium]|nr:PqqD family protein [Clostridia bacterium]
MKIREGFILRDVAGQSFVVATGALSREYQGMITLNETGKFIWQCLEKQMSSDQIVDAVVAEYEDADRAVVAKDVEGFINKLVKDKIVE